MAQLERQLGLGSASILVVANMVGTGIFTTSGFIMAELGNTHALLFCWLIGGLFALCGALCFGELGAMFPRAGGEYVFLRESLGPPMGFLSGWISLIVGFSAPIAAASFAFATYLFQTLPLPTGFELLIPFSDLPVVVLTPKILVALGVILFFSLLHSYSVPLGTRVQNLLTGFKIGFVVVFVLLALVAGEGSTDHFSSDVDLGFLLHPQFAVSLILVAFAYSGWNAAAYLGGEIRNPGRNIPLSLLVGTLLVMGLYLALNIAYIYALPRGEIAGVLEVGAKSAAFLFGESVSRYFNGAIALGLLSVLSAMILAGPRVYYAMAQDGVFFRGFARVNKRHKTPGRAIFLQAGIAMGMVLTTAFDRLLLYIGFTLSLIAVLTVMGLMLLRFRHPRMERPYRTFGYPIPPLLFICGNAWIIYFSIRSRPITCAWGLATIALGIVVYFMFRKSTGGIDTEESTNM
jgi:APA family basic amino acid/polyamine antiporter